MHEEPLVVSPVKYNVFLLPRLKTAVCLQFKTSSRTSLFPHCEGGGHTSKRGRSVPIPTVALHLSSSLILEHDLNILNLGQDRCREEGRAHCVRVREEPGLGGGLEKPRT